MHDEVAIGAGLLGALDEIVDGEAAAPCYFISELVVFCSLVTEWVGGVLLNT